MARPIPIKDFAIRDGRVARDQRRLSVSERLRQRSSKRVKPVRRGQLR